MDSIYGTPQPRSKDCNLLAAYFCSTYVSFHVLSEYAIWMSKQQEPQTENNLYTYVYICISLSVNLFLFFHFDISCNIS